MKLSTCGRSRYVLRNKLISVYISRVGDVVQQRQSVLIGSIMTAAVFKALLPNALGSITRSKVVYTARQAPCFEVYLAKGLQDSIPLIVKACAGLFFGQVDAK
jgi:hypothetical protein